MATWLKEVPGAWWGAIMGTVVAAFAVYANDEVQDRRIEDLETDVEEVEEKAVETDMKLIRIDGRLHRIEERQEEILEAIRELGR